MRAHALVLVVALVACADGERRSGGVASTTSSSSGAAIAPERPASGGAPPPEVASPAPLASSSRLTASHASCSCTEEPPPPCTCGVVHYRTDSPHTDALRWLRRHQRPEGSFDAPCGVTPPCLESGVAVIDTTRATALATLAFLGQGHTHRFGTWKRAVSAALGALRGSRPEAPTDALVACTWARALAASRDASLTSDLERALAPIVARARGAIDDHHAWDREALAAAEAVKLADVPAPPERWTWGPAPLRDAGLSTFARGPLDVTPCAASVRLRADPSLDPRWLLAVLPPRGARDRQVVNPTAWLWGAWALRGRDDATLRAWFDATERTILPAQRSGECACGSWDPPPGWTRIEATAVCVLALQEGLAWERAKER